METTIPSPVDSLLHLTAARLKQAVRRGYESRAAFDVTGARNVGVRQRLEELLGEHGCLAYQACVLSDAPWQILWSANRESYLPFFERAFTLVAFRDPVGPEQSRAALLAQFLALARARGKYAVIMLATENARKAGLGLGFGGLWVGVEPLFDLAQHSLAGKPGRKLRQDTSHMRRLGGTAREIFPLQNPAEQQAMAEVERQWKARRAGPMNTSFLAMNPLENAPSRRYFAVETGGYSPDPIMQSFMVCSPVGDRGWFLQDLVRRPDAPRGAAEMAALAAMETFRAEGVAFVTMGVVPFSYPAGPGAAGKTGLLARLSTGYWDQMYHFSGLQRFRAKFAPTRTERVSILYWPSILTPLMVWDLTAVLVKG